jgi:hypothetical protein
LSNHEQSVIDRDHQAFRPMGVRGGGVQAGAFAASLAPQDVRTAEHAARASLRAQITRLERECSEIVAGRFPHIPAPFAAPALADGRSLAPAGATGPSLLDLGELERSRDRLAGRVQELRARADARSRHERRAHELLREMELDPGSYRFAKLSVRDLGQGGCGVWKVCPRLGLIGMLAGWWHLTLSSGCPLPRGSCSTHDPGLRT